jgi:hypothetical protein
MQRQWLGDSINELQALAKDPLGYKPSSAVITTSLGIPYSPVESKLFHCFFHRKPMACILYRFGYEIRQSYKKM